MPHPPRSTVRGLSNALVLLLVIGGLAVVGGMLVVRGGGDAAAAATAAGERWTVRTGSFDITVPAAGELAASSQVEIASQLERRAVITRIVEEGTLVRQGDVLIKLDDEEIVNLISEEELAVENAAAALTAAESALEVRKLTGESAMSLAEVDVRLAETAL